jgi:hypothetical protein
MEELGLDAAVVASWFVESQQNPRVLVRVTKADPNRWACELSEAIRRCYISDAMVESNAQARGASQIEIVMSKMPDPGSVMAGDFGEIVTYLYHAAQAHPKVLSGPKKWRLKQDRLKPAPHSDVVHFHLPDWPTPSTEDAIYCSEVKTKSTPGQSEPIDEAVNGCTKDRVSRLARTLTWLRERALTENIGNVTLEQLKRFINATEYPPAQRHFYAVAVICESLVNDELKRTAAVSGPECTVVVVVISDLKLMYMTAFNAAINSALLGVPVDDAVA